MDGKMIDWFARRYRPSGDWEGTGDFWSGAACTWICIAGMSLPALIVLAVFWLAGVPLTEKATEFVLLLGIVLCITPSMVLAMKFEDRIAKRAREIGGHASSTTTS